MVIDTNVLLVAEGLQEAASARCVAECARRLYECRQSESKILIDDAFEIIKEYKKKLSPDRPLKPGSLFLKWLLQNRSNSARIIACSIISDGAGRYKPFPDKPDQSVVDEDDRKFISVAHSHNSEVAIFQALDSQWMDWQVYLRDEAISVEWICEDEARVAYQRKYRRQPPKV